MTQLFRTLFTPGVVTSLWIGGLVTFLVFGDPSRLRAPRNIALALLLSGAVLLADILHLGREGSRFASLLFTAVMLYSLGCAAWAGALTRRPLPGGWRVNPSRNGLRALVAALVVLDAGSTLGRYPDDAGNFSSLGAQRWVETGTLPYADSLLQGPDAPGHGASAIFGPLLYVATVPFQVITGQPHNAPDANPRDRSYRRPAVLATQMACLAFHLVGLWAMFNFVKRLTDEPTALGAVALYAASPFVLGLGGDDAEIAGLTYISHIAPATLILLSLWALERPLLAGAFLAAAAATLIWPVILFPAWLGWYVGRRHGASAFTAGYAIVGLLSLAIVLTGTHTASPLAALGMMKAASFQHIEGSGTMQFGASTFGFWGTHPSLRALFQFPFAVLTGFVVLGGFVAARGRTPAQLAASGAVPAALVQAWKTNAGGTFINWFFPLLLVGLLCCDAGTGPRRDVTDLSPDS